MDENENIPYQIDFANGRIVSGRWKVLSRIGTGAYGVVYSVQDIQKPANVAALKVEINQDSENSMLKIEFEVLQRLQDRPNTIRLFGAGKRTDYSFLVITLCGADLAKLRQEKKITKFTESTTLRIGVHGLYAVKQLHEVGYIHRDIKPQNFVIGGTEKDSRILYLIDFGMVRQYAILDEKYDDNGKVIKNDGPKKWIIRKPRKKVLLRGTLRYCSLNVHKRMEQGRSDDIYSLIYMLVEMRYPLPWSAAQREERLIALKETFTADPNVNKCEGIRDILCYLQNLKYSDRPDYKFIYNCLMEVIKKRKYKFSDPYDWEESSTVTPPKKQQQNLDDSGKKRKKPSSSSTPTAVPHGHGAPTITVTVEDNNKKDGGDGTNTPSSVTDSTYSNKSEGVSQMGQVVDSRAIDVREIQSSSTTPTTSPPGQLEETTAREDSLRNYKDAKENLDKPSSSDKRPTAAATKPKKQPTLEEDPPAASPLPPTGPSNKKKADVGCEKSTKNKKKSSSTPASSNQTSGRPVEKSMYIEFSKYKKEGTGTSTGGNGGGEKPPLLMDDEFFPTAIPSAFDFKPGDIPSGSSAAIKDQDKQNSARSDLKNMKSVMSNYGTPPPAL